MAHRHPDDDAAHDRVPDPGAAAACLRHPHRARPGGRALRLARPDCGGRLARRRWRGARYRHGRRAHTDRR